MRASYLKRPIENKSSNKKIFYTTCDSVGRMVSLNTAGRLKRGILHYGRSSREVQKRSLGEFPFISPLKETFTRKHQTWRGGIQFLKYAIVRALYTVPKII